jgi:type IV secretory pathway VirB4 component
MGIFDFFSRKKKEEDSFEESISEMDEYLLTALTPDYIEEKENYLQLGSNFTRTLLVMDFSTVISQEDIQELSEISSNVSITYHFEKVSNTEIRSSMSQAIKQSRNKQSDPKLDDASKVEAEVQMDDAAMVIREMATGSEVMFRGHMLVHINAPSLRDLDRLTQSIKSQLGSIGTAYSPSTKAFDAFQSFLPLGKNKVGELTHRLMNSEAVSYLFPFHENEMFDEEGIFSGVNEKTRNVILVDSNKLLNKHKFYIGISGVGKSTALFTDIIKEWMQGVTVIVNDPKGEFGPVFKRMGGEWIRFSQNGGSRLNPFDLPKKRYQVENDDYITSENPIYDKIPSLLVMFKLMYPTMTDLEENIVSGLIEETYTEKGILEDTNFSKLVDENFPTLSDFEETILSTKLKDPERYAIVRDFHLAIQIYISGIYKNVFNGYTNVSVDNDLVAYDSLAFQQNEKVQRILYYNIMSHISYMAINGDGREMRVVFDEAHVIADPKIPLAMQQLYFMMKVLRSFNVGVSPATQSIKDLLSAKDDKRNYGEAVINQAVQKMYLPMMDVEIEFLEKEMSHKFSEKEKAILTVRDGDKKKQAGKGILFIGSKKIQCTVKLTKMEEELWFHKKELSQIKI